MNTPCMSSPQFHQTLFYHHLPNLPKGCEFPMCIRDLESNPQSPRVYDAVIQSRLITPHHTTSCVCTPTTASFRSSQFMLATPERITQIRKCRCNHSHRNRNRNVPLLSITNQLYSSISFFSPSIHFADSSTPRRAHALCASGRSTETCALDPPTQSPHFPRVGCPPPVCRCTPANPNLRPASSVFGRSVSFSLLVFIM